MELYVDGKGPRHVFKAPLKGWEANRLDLEGIMDTYRLKNLFAYSLDTGRGNRLYFNPKNGLSLVCYSGKPDVVVRLDADSKESYLLLLGKVLFGVILIGGLAFVALSPSLPEPLLRLREMSGRHMAWLICFIIIIFTQLVWRPAKRRLRR